VAGVFGGGDDPGPAAVAGNPAGEVVGEPIAVGKKPYDVEVGETGVLVANLDDGTLSVIDPDTDEVESIKVGGAPSAVAEGEGGIWTTNFAGSITRVDPGTGHVSEAIPGGGDTGAGIAVGEGGVWLTDQDADTVEQIDPSSLDPVGKPIKVGRKPFAVAVGDNTVYVANQDDETVSEIVVGDDRPYAEIEIGARPFGLEYHDPRIYVGSADGTVDIKVTPYDETSTAPGTSIPLPDSAGAVVVDPEGSSLWAVQPVDGTLSRYDLETGEQIGEPIDVGASPQDVAAGDGFVWVTNGDDNTVTKVQPGP
jgi:YVTN family beta-propeller protein